MNTRTSTNNRQAYLLNLPFIIGLALLILNDHLFKGIFGNWFTGKLSDFAGILILPLFLKFIFNRSNITSILLALVIFLFWKSPFSGVFIDFYNSISPISIYRVVDYSDFLAFAMLPLSYYILNEIQSFAIDINHHQRWATQLVFAISTLSFIATQPAERFDINLDSSITSCCNDIPTATTVGEGNIFIPNIFTPDNNGINDVFQIVVNESIARIDTFRIQLADTDSIIFYQENIIDITPETGWDGTFNDTIAPAQYIYDITVTSVDDVKVRFIGYVCCLPCADPTGLLRPENISTCGFATQYDVNTGIYDPNAPTLEDLDCFE